jgi:hypothetical protein
VVIKGFRLILLPDKMLQFSQPILLPLQDDVGFEVCFVDSSVGLVADFEDFLAGFDFVYS